MKKNIIIIAVVLLVGGLAWSAYASSAPEKEKTECTKKEGKKKCDGEKKACSKEGKKECSKEGKKDCDGKKKECCKKEKKDTDA